MTAEEIRKSLVPIAGHREIIPIRYLAEIAAQLADLNEFLRTMAARMGWMR